MLKHQRLLSIILATSLVLPACKGGDENAQQQSQRSEKVTKTVTIQQTVAEGLDLSTLPELVAEAKNGEELEKLLNTSEINNLDLNQDNQIDYLNVEEFREGANRGFLLFTNEDNQRNELAQIMINQQSQSADVVVQGNPEYYGNEARYHSSFPLSEILLVGWLFNMSRPRYYHTPYYVGRYPSYYSTRRPVSSSLYRSRLSSSRSRLGVSKSRPTTTYKSTTTSKAGATNASSRTKKSLNSVQGNSFSTTAKKRPAGSSTSSRSSSTTGSSFGSSSSRKRSSSSFGSSSSSTSSSRRSSSRSFGSSSSRRRR